MQSPTVFHSWAFGDLTRTHLRLHLRDEVLCEWYDHVVLNHNWKTDWMYIIFLKTFVCLQGYYFLFFWRIILLCFLCAINNKGQRNPTCHNQGIWNRKQEMCHQWDSAQYVRFEHSKLSVLPFRHFGRVDIHPLEFGLEVFMELLTDLGTPSQNRYCSASVDSYTLTSHLNLKIQYSFHACWKAEKQDV